MKTPFRTLLAAHFIPAALILASAGLAYVADTMLSRLIAEANVIPTMRGILSVSGTPEGFIAQLLALLASVSLFAALQCINFAPQKPSR